MYIENVSLINIQIQNNLRLQKWEHTSLSAEIERAYKKVTMREI